MIIVIISRFTSCCAHARIVGHHSASIMFLCFLLFCDLSLLCCVVCVLCCHRHLYIYIYIYICRERERERVIIITIIIIIILCVYSASSVVLGGSTGAGKDAIVDGIDDDDDDDVPPVEEPKLYDCSIVDYNIVCHIV